MDIVVIALPASLDPETVQTYQQLKDKGGKGIEVVGNTAGPNLTDPDVLLSKLARLDSQDQDRIRRSLGIQSTVTTAPTTH